MKHSEKPRLFLALRDPRNIKTAARVNGEPLVFSLEDEVTIITDKQRQKGVWIDSYGDECMLKDITNQSHLDVIDVAKLVIKEIKLFEGTIITNKMKLIRGKDENHVSFKAVFNGRKYKFIVRLAKFSSHWAKIIGSLKVSYIDLGEYQVWQDELDHIIYKFF